MKLNTLFILLFISASSLIAGCGTGDESQNSSSDTLSLDLQLPDSLTGGRTISTRDLAQRVDHSSLALRGGTGEPCAYQGIENDEELFENGYQTTRFLVSIMATWTCIADVLIDVAEIVPHDGSLVETGNDILATNYDPDEPTHYSITDDSSTQRTVRMYYAYDRADPPTEQAVPGFYISWNESSEQTVRGRLIVDVNEISADAHDPDDPVRMRMDFDFDDDAKSADMFLQFDDSHPWADGMRIDIRKDLSANLFDHVYTARGMINMKSQLFQVEGIDEVPEIQFFTVADGLGNGAAIEEIRDLTLPLVPNVLLDNHLGNYLFTKTDIYFFDDSMDWDYIYKFVSSASYRGGRTTADTGGSWIPFNPSLDMIVSALSLDPAYFTGDLCAVEGDDCSELLNTIFIDGFAGQEQNQGSDPMDWRSTALESVDYLSSVYPNGIDWDGAFEQIFSAD